MSTRLLVFILTLLFPVLATFSEDTSTWYVTTDVDPIDDSKTISLSLLPTGVYSGHPILGVRHSNNGEEVYVFWDTYIGDTMNVTTRIDSELAVTEGWSPSTTGRASFSSNPLGMIAKLLRSKRAVFRVVESSGTTHTLIFDTSKFAETVRKNNKDLDVIEPWVHMTDQKKQYLYDRDRDAIFARLSDLLKKEGLPASFSDPGEGQIWLRLKGTDFPADVVKAEIAEKVRTFLLSLKTPFGELKPAIRIYFDDDYLDSIGADDWK